MISAILASSHHTTAKGKICDPPVQPEAADAMESAPLA